MSQLSLSNVHFMHGNKPILQGINLEINKGEMLGVIGPNGAGKSSLIKLLSGYYQTNSGVVRLEHQRLNEVSGEERARKVAYLPQVSRVEFPYSVSEVVSLGLQNGSLSREEKKASISYYLKELHIDHLATRQINTLSGGEQQLVHIARILAQQANILLLDEPCSSLDIGHESQLMNLLHRLSEQGKSVVVALHNLNTAAEFCDKLLLLGSGETVAYGAPEKVLTSEHLHRLYPQNVAVTMNLQTGNPNILPIKEV